MGSFTQKEGIQKLKDLVEKNGTCLFCIDLKTDDGASCSPMQALNVCDHGNIWFLSDINSAKNRAIKFGNHVQLFFSDAKSDSYFIVNGKAEIIIDQQKIEDLWMPVAGNWFKNGKNDSNISIIKVKPQIAYYWDTDAEKMVSFFKMLSSASN